MEGSSAPLPAGAILAGKYRIEHVLGTGGMGVVVAAWHVLLQQRVAIKFLLPAAASDPEAVERFAREARAAVRLKSDHVARIIDVGAMGTGLPYIVMEHLEGTDVAAILRRDGPLPAALAADYVIQALDALGEAHARGIVHRDLKPGNLFVTRRADGASWVKVLDFGISKCSPASGDVALTRSQSILGSPAYMSPEHMRASRLADARSDIWSLGVILYQLVSGRLPFADDTFSALVIKVAMAPTPPLAPSPRVPAGFEDVIRRCLEKEPDGRFQTAAELAAALAPFAPPCARLIVQRVRNLRPGEAGAPSGSGPPADVRPALRAPATLYPSWAALSSPTRTTPPRLHVHAASTAPEEADRAAGRGGRSSPMLAMSMMAALTVCLPADFGGGRGDDLAGAPPIEVRAPAPPPAAESSIDWNRALSSREFVSSPMPVRVSPTSPLSSLRDVTASGAPAPAPRSTRATPEPVSRPKRRHLRVEQTAPSPAGPDEKDPLADPN